MSISYQFGDVDAHGALIRSQAASLEAEHQSIVRDVLAAGDFWGGSGSVACQEFITQLGRNFQTIYEQANCHGQKVQTAGNNMCVHRLRRRRQLGLTLTVGNVNDVGVHQHSWRRQRPQPAGLPAFFRLGVPTVEPSDIDGDCRYEAGKLDAAARRGARGW